MSEDRDSQRREILELLHFYREEERHEIAWINNRLQWLLITQSFLLTIAVTLLSNDYKTFPRLVMGTILWIFALILAQRAFVAIRAAQIVIEAWLEKEGRLRETHLHLLWRFSLNRGLHKGQRTKDDFHKTAIAYHRFAPLILGLMWALYAGCLYAYACYEYFSCPNQVLWSLLTFVVTVFLIGVILSVFTVPDFKEVSNEKFEADVKDLATENDVYEIWMKTN
jgi:hypothetical protein